VYLLCAGYEEEEDPGGIITPALMDEQETFAFSMCNPPFFESIHVRNAAH
jgi:23S rRNA A1618 N6-methylase RlmF